MLLFFRFVSSFCLFELLLFLFLFVCPHTFLPQCCPSCMISCFLLFPVQAGGKAGKDSGKAKAKAVSRSQRAGLQVNLSMFITVICDFFFFFCYFFVLLKSPSCVCFLPVPSGSYPQALEDSYNQPWSCRSHSSCVQCCYS